MNRKTYLYLAAIFLVGALTGGLLGATLTKQYLVKALHPKALASRIEKELTQKLGLDDAQQKTTRLLVDRSMARIMGIYAETIQKVDAELLDAQKELTSELTPEQRIKLKDLAASRQDFLRKHAPVAPTGL
ncbi:MAG: hypothetical protein D4R65_00410 [Verrucomicrobiaceae bacterium]|nr:MAG: hypothetical protein D4R65_00410 [Verrucomicrobiaceae bacterium]